MKDTMTFVKGLGAGMIAGATAFAIGKVVLNSNKNLSKGSAKVVKAMGDLVEGVQTVFR